MNHNEYITTGFPTLDEAIGGFRPAELTIIGGRPSMGKTAFMLSMARNMVIEHEIGVALFSLELSATQLGMRLVVAETDLSRTDILSGRLTPDQWRHLENSVKSLGTAPFYIDDTPSLSIAELREKCLQLKAEKNIQVVFIDYLQLLTFDDGTDKTLSETACMEQRLKSLKAIAQELKLPVVVFSQLERSRDIGPKQPTLENFRESASVVRQLADKILLIYRPEYYYVGDDDNDNSIKGHAEIIIAKCAGCAVDSIALRFDKEHGIFL